MSDSLLQGGAMFVQHPPGEVKTECFKGDSALVGSEPIGMLFLILLIYFFAIETIYFI